MPPSAPQWAKPAPAARSRRLTGFAIEPLCHLREENPKEFPERASRARPRRTRERAGAALNLKVP